jgi:tRNA splicing endonuclease
MVKFTDKGFIASDEKEILKLNQAGFGRQLEQDFILHYLEAAYCIEYEFAEVKEGRKKLNLEDVLKKLKVKRGGMRAKNQYLVYKHIRSGGRIIRFSPSTPNYFRVHARGVGREQERSQIIVRLINDDFECSIDSLEMELAVARQLRLELVFAFVRDGKPQFVKMAKYNFD